jgi:hypothetical protein
VGESLVGEESGRVVGEKVLGLTDIGKDRVLGRKIASKRQARLSVALWCDPSERLSLTTAG